MTDAAAPPPVVVELAWQGERRFAGRAGEVALVLDGEHRAGLSPVEALVAALGGCMAIDVVDILARGRLPLAGLDVRLAGERPAGFPRRLLAVDLHFVVRGEVPADRVERAIALSRETYCSVWHSLRPDIDLRTSFEVRPAGPG